MKVSQNAHLYGFPALYKELERQGIALAELQQEAKLPLDRKDLDVQERLNVFRASKQLSKKNGTALLAGQQQEISYYGPYGYLLATSATMADAFRLGREFFALSGSLFRVTLDIENGVGTFRSHEPESLGEILPFVAEYWRSSQSRIFSLVLGEQFPSIAMKFPYKKPSHASLYNKVFQCGCEFDSDVMEWQFDASVFERPCVHADSNTAKLCEKYCEQFVGDSGGNTPLQRQILRICVSNLASSHVDAKTVSNKMNMSVRTLHRKLDAEGTSYKLLVDRLRSSVAIEYLSNTNIPVEEIASRCGYQDVSNFRKAFRRWTGKAPSEFRT